MSLCWVTTFCALAVKAVKDIAALSRAILDAIFVKRPSVRERAQAHTPAQPSCNMKALPRSGLCGFSFCEPDRTKEGDVPRPNRFRRQTLTAPPKIDSDLLPPA